MNMLAFAINTAERTPMSDGVSLAAIDLRCSRMKRRPMSTTNETERAFVDEMDSFPVATHTVEAKCQHCELPAEFFAQVLGPQIKYSCCLYLDATTSVADAEALALAETIKHAEIEDVVRILELGCGWGSLSLYLARKFPNACILSVSNSVSQRSHILSVAKTHSLGNLDVITADMNEFETGERFDNVVSVEMFEHMSNWNALLHRIRGWIKPDGKLFLDVFTHTNRSHCFDRADPCDWIAQHFFTGGIMPAHDLPHRFGNVFDVEAEWRWSGMNYLRAALDWLANFDRNVKQIHQIFNEVYGADAALWQHGWRLFFSRREGCAVMTAATYGLRATI